MKVLLLQPPVRDFYDTDIRLQPLGLCSLKAAVGRALPQVEVLVRDYHQGHGRRTVPLPRELSYLRDYFLHPDKGPFSTFHAYCHFGASFEAIAADVAREAPDLVGISSLFTPYASEALATATAIKERTSVPILLGGAHVSCAPGEVLGHPAVDFVIRGEGERPLVSFLHALLARRGLAGVPNLGYKRDGGQVFTPLAPNDPLETLPWPDFSDLSRDRYTLQGRPLCTLLTSRGCPFHCAFCSVHQTFAQGYRRRPVSDVLAEILFRYRQGYRVMDFEDDNLTHNKHALLELLEGVSEALPPGEVLFTAMNGVSYLHLDDELLRRMRTVGFQDLNLSLVSVDRGLLSRLRRPHDEERFRRVVGSAFRAGFRIVAYVILGIPGDTLHAMCESLAFLARLPLRIGASLFYMTPGCALSHAFPGLAGGDPLTARATAMAIETEAFQREDLYTLFVCARILNFLKGIPVPGKTAMLWEALRIARSQGRRGASGADLLERLLTERILYAETRSGARPLRRFRPDLFLRLWERAFPLCTLGGTTLSRDAGG